MKVVFDPTPEDCDRIFRESAVELVVDKPTNLVYLINGGNMRSIPD